jgi:hypothetical protein
MSLFFGVLVCLVCGSWGRTGPARDLPVMKYLEKKAISPFSLDWDNSIAICAIMRGENTEDLREWLQYHR